MPLVANILEVLDAALWDREQLIPYKRTYLFAVPRGQAGKDTSDTSMCRSGQIQPGKRFVVNAVRIAFINRLTGAFVPISHPVWWNTFFEFGFRKKPYVEGPIHLFAEPLLCPHVSAFRKAESTFDKILQWCHLLPKTQRSERAVPYYVLRFSLTIEPDDYIHCWVDYQPKVKSPHMLEDVIQDIDVLVVLDGVKYRQVE